MGLRVCVTLHALKGTLPRLLPRLADHEDSYAVLKQPHKAHVMHHFEPRR